MNSPLCVISLFAAPQIFAGAGIHLDLLSLTKYKNVITGAIREESFNPTAKFEQASVERKDAEYSYNDGFHYSRSYFIPSRR